MKKLSLAIAAALGLVSLSASAGSTSANFDVSVALTSKCQVKGSPKPVTFEYEALNGVTAQAPGEVVFECTRGFAAPKPTVQLDAAAGVVGGLQYTLALAPAVVSAGTAASTSSIGTPDAYTYTILGAMADGQAGDASAPTVQTRTLTISY